MKAYDNIRQGIVAVKCTQRFVRGDDGDQGIPVVQLREAAIVRSLDHPNIVSFYDVILTPTAIYFVMELGDCNLREHLRELESRGDSTLSEVALRGFGRQLFSALAYCHAAHIMHRWDF